MSNKQKLLFVIWGESFRYGPPQTRGRGTGDYFKRQEYATSSHIDLVDSLKSQYDINIIINTYKLNNKDDNILCEWYKKMTDDVSIYLHDRLFWNEVGILNDTYNKINNKIENNKYDFIFIFRIDLYLKNYLINNFNKYLLDDKIIFGHIDSNSFIIENPLYKVNICHFISIIPYKFFNIILEKLIYNHRHTIAQPIVYKYGNNCIDFMINTLHICSTDLGWNPLYIQVGRNYKKSYQKTDVSGNTISYYYDKELNKLVYDIDKTINYWNLYIEKEQNNFDFK